MNGRISNKIHFDTQILEEEKTNQKACKYDDQSLPICSDEEKRIAFVLQVKV
jgi:hypothetical protein